MTDTKEVVKHTEEELLQPEQTPQPEEEATDKAKLLTLPATDDEEQEPEMKQLQDLLKAMSIDGMWFRKQLGVFFLLAFGMILYITNRYQAQQEMIEEDKLRKELHDWKYRAMTRNSELTLHSRQSQVEDRLKAYGDSTLLPSKLPPFILKDE